MGKGEIFLFSYARGCAPCIPGIRPPAALTEPAKQVTGGRARWFWSPANPAFSFLSCPLSPQPPSPEGKGEIFCFLMQGAAPLAFPALDRLRHLQRLSSRCPAGGYSPCGTCSPCPGGEDHLKRRSSSPPVPPLLGWRHCSPVPRPNRHAPPGIGTPPQPRLARDKAPRRVPGRQLQSVPRGFSPGDARGGAPCMKITLVSPFPLGRGGRGIGVKNLLYDRKNRRGRTQPPAGNHNGRSSRCRAGARPPCPLPGTPSFLPPPPANKKFRKSSWGFGGFFQEAPNASLPPAPLITAAASGASTMPGMPNRRKPAYMESRDRRGWMPSERPTRCGSAISRRTEEIA